MKVLGIETSCDETSVSVVEDGSRLLSLVVNSQIDIHKAFGGVVPEIAARSHIEVMLPVVEQALNEANLSWSDIDAIAVTQGPGLLGSLLIGVLTARTLAGAFGKPLFPVHHIMGHVYANWITSTVFSDDTSLRTPMLGQHSRNTPPSTSRSRLVSSRETADEQLAVSNETMELNRESQTANALPIANRSSLILPSEQPEFPVLALIVSGGHSQLMWFEDHLRCRILGRTQDDAVGEAFDKVAKVLGLPYPGGPSIEQSAPKGDKQAFKLPFAKLGNPYDFSFSGLKTAVLRAAQNAAGVGYNFPSFELKDRLSSKQKLDLAASFQATAIETLVKATKKAEQEFQPKTMILGGGVAASRALRQRLREVLDLPLSVTDPKLCTDNAAMIAALGYFTAQKSKPASPLNLTVEPSLKIPTI